MTLDEMFEIAKIRDLTFVDVESYCVQTGQKASVALDAASRVIACKYLAKEISYEIGDAIMNSFFAYGIQHDVITDFTSAIFGAFDAGEYYPDKIREPSPEERFTRPQIMAILAKDKHS